MSSISIGGYYDQQTMPFLNVDITLVRRSKMLSVDYKKGLSNASMKETTNFHKKMKIPNLIYAQESNENQNKHPNLTPPFIWKTCVLLSPSLDGL